MQGAHKIAACLLYLGRMISKVLWRRPGCHQYNVKHTQCASTHTHRGDQKHARAQSLLYLTFLGLSSLFIIFRSSKGVNFLVRFRPIAINHIFCHRAPKAPHHSRLQIHPKKIKKARIGWRVMPARQKHRNINHSMSPRRRRRR